MALGTGISDGFWAEGGEPSWTLCRELKCTVTKGQMFSLFEGEGCIFWGEKKSTKSMELELGLTFKQCIEKQEASSNPVTSWPCHAVSPSTSKGPARGMLTKQ